MKNLKENEFKPPPDKRHRLSVWMAVFGFLLGSTLLLSLVYMVYQ